MSMYQNDYQNDDAMSSELKSLQIKSSFSKILLFGGFAGTFIAMIAGATVLSFVCVAVAIVGGILTANAGKKVKQYVGDNILKLALDDVFDDVDYRPFEHLSSETVDSADFRFSYDKIEGNDFVSANYHGLHVEMSDVSLKEISTDSDGHTHESTVFRGMWMVCDFGKTLTADVRVCERSKLGKMLGKSGIHTENEAFNKQFHIRCTNEEEAFYILTPHMMEYIVAMDAKANAKTNLSFLRDGKLHIALNSGRDAFEVKGTASDTKKIREQFVAEIRQVTDLIDELRLVDTMFTA